MLHIKNVCIHLIVISIFFLFIPISFAIPGQLIYDVNAPQQTANSLCDEALSTCNSLYKTCSLQKSQQEQMYTLLADNLAQERRMLFVMKIMVIVVSLSSVVFFVYLKKGYKQ